MKKAWRDPKKILPLTIRGVLVFMFLGLCLFSCDQHEIFYDVSREVKPKEPYIPGSPTKIVEAGNILYVSNGKSLFKYEKSAWSEISKPAGTISDVAAGSALYCIVENKTLYRLNNAQWEQVSVPGGYTYLQNIYGTGSGLYLCASKDNVYTILSVNGTTLKSLKTGTGEGFFLRGAAGSYIALTNGIYNASNPNNPITGSSGYIIMGIIQLNGGTVAASTKDGYILHGNGSSFSAASFGLTFDRAMARYGNNLLLVGVYTKGFVEIELNNGSWPNFPSSHSPGQGTYGQTTTAHDNAQYRSSLGIQSLTGLYRAQDGVLFASTQQKGLWAYQLGEEGWQWNAY
jgi:hypothetical protein